MSYGEFVRRVITTITIILLTFFIITGVIQYIGILLIVFTCWVLSVGLHHLIMRFRKLGMNKGLATLSTLAVVIASLVMVGFVIVPPFLTQAKNLVESLPQAIEQIIESYTTFRQEQPAIGNYLPEFTVDDYHELFSMGVEEVMNEISPETSTDTTTEVPEKVTDNIGSRGGNSLLNIDIGQLVQSALPVLGNIGNLVGSLLANAIFIILITSYLLFDPVLYYRPIVALVPKNHEKRVVDIINKIETAVIGWMGALSISIAFTTTAIIIVHGLILGIPNVIALGVIAGLSSFVPNVGYYIGLIPILIFTAVADPVKIIPAGILYWLISEIDGKVVSPNVIKNQLNIPAGIVFPFQLMAAASLGFFGIILAVPILAILVIIFQELYIFDTLKKRNHQVDLVENEDGLVELVVSDTGIDVMPDDETDDD
jgi:predicted PurR-regulated permease PerM